MLLRGGVPGEIAVRSLNMAMIFGGDETMARERMHVHSPASGDAQTSWNRYLAMPQSHITVPKPSHKKLSYHGKAI